MARYDAGGGSRSIAVDTAGNVYVTGDGYDTEAVGLTDHYYGTVKYDADGNELWVARYNGPANAPDSGSDMAAALTVDSSGNVYVTGSSDGSDSFSDYATIKLASSHNGGSDGESGSGGGGCFLRAASERRNRAGF